DHYRVVSLIPVPLTRRYKPGKGVYPFERTVSGKEWRWLDRHAELELSSAPGSSAAMSFYLPPDAPEESTTVMVTAGASKAQVTVRRGVASSLRLPIPDARSVTIHFDTATGYVPASVLGNRDPRLLAVQLLAVERRP
ncbi:MAG TPA: hypothetical protein VHL58_13365, partial [Thermoanaerobaculia bacterium]|nr:hypothetical protein [Thermoanaerobaculia bacterium]